MGKSKKERRVPLWLKITGGIVLGLVALGAANAVATRNGYGITAS